MSGPTSASTASSDDPGSPLKAVDSIADALLEKVRASCEKWKAEGNLLFKQSQFEAAATAYSKSIEECEGLADPASVGSLHIHLCNRALCNIKLENFGKNHIINESSSIQGLQFWMRNGRLKSTKRSRKHFIAEVLLTPR